MKIIVLVRVVAQTDLTTSDNVETLQKRG